MKTLYERASEYISNHKGEIHLNQKITKVIQDNTGKVTGVQLEDGTIEYADKVISTMPLTYLLKGLNNVPSPIKKAANSLYFRNTILVYLEVDALDLFKDNWIYVHSPEVKHGRITNFRNWSPTLNSDKKTTILCMEFWAFNEDEIWSENDKNLSELAIKEIKSLNLLPKTVNILNTTIIRVPKCYPVYETGYQEPLKKVENYLDTIENLIPIGRYGAFKYNNQDHSILMGILAAEQITTGKSINLWEINTDIEYQEDAKIKDVLIH